MLFGRVITSRPSLVLGRLFLTDSIDTIELVLMDREFDSKAVKAVCEEHGVYYLNPKRTLNSEQEHCRQLAARNATVDVVERTPVDAPDHYQLYVPKRNGPQVTPDDLQHILVPPAADDDKAESDRQDELWDDLEETLGTDIEGNDHRAEDDEDPALGIWRPWRVKGSTNPARALLRRRQTTTSCSRRTIRVSTPTMLSSTSATPLLD